MIVTEIDCIRENTRDGRNSQFVASPLQRTFYEKIRVTMKITLFAAGSRGDIQPCVALSKGLQQAGYHVCLAAPQDFADFIQQHGVDFSPLRGDVQQIMASDTGRSFMETGGANPLKSIRAVRTMIAPVVMRMVQDAYAAAARRRH